MANSRRKCSVGIYCVFAAYTQRIYSVYALLKTILCSLSVWLAVRLGARVINRPLLIIGFENKGYGIATTYYLLLATVSRRRYFLLSKFM